MNVFIISFLFPVLVFWLREAGRILDPGPGIELTPLALEGEVLTTVLQRYPSGGHLNHRPVHVTFLQEGCESSLGAQALHPNSTSWTHLPSVCGWMLPCLQVLFLPGKLLCFLQDLAQGISSRSSPVSPGESLLSVLLTPVTSLYCPVSVLDLSTSRGLLRFVGPGSSTCLHLIYACHRHECLCGEGSC